MSQPANPTPVLIMAGGRGTRLGDATRKLPKPLVQVGGRPILATLIQDLVQQGFHTITLAIGHQADLIERYFGDGTRFGASISYVRESHPLGTAGAVALAFPGLDREFIVTNADLLTRLKALGCGVQMGAFRWVTSTDPNVIVGPPFRTIVEHGIQTGMMGDGVHIAPLNPWLQIYFATTGVNSFGARVNGNQQLTREEALRLFTRGNSWFLRMEEKIGSIEPGKLADVAVLDRDYFSVPDADIKKVRSVLTVVGGNIVHRQNI